MMFLDSDIILRKLLNTAITYFMGLTEEAKSVLQARRSLLADFVKE